MQRRAARHRLRHVAVNDYGQSTITK